MSSAQDFNCCEHTIDDIFSVMDREASTAMHYLSWPTDALQHTVNLICTRLCNAEKFYRSYDSIQLLFCEVSPFISEPSKQMLFTDDWTGSHEHVFSDSAKFLSAACELMRGTVFGNPHLHSAVEHLLPFHTDLAPLQYTAPRLYRFFKQAYLRSNFDALDIDAIIAPIFSAEFDRLIGTLYNSGPIKHDLIEATQLAARLYLAMGVYGDARFRFDGLTSDMVVDMHTLETPSGKAWRVVLPAVTVVDTFGMERVIVKAMAFNDSLSCEHCPNAWLRLAPPGEDYVQEGSPKHEECSCT